MKNSMQLKAYVKNLAKKKGLSPQLILQNYLLERFLERISKSIFCDAIILKGGLLIASMVGIDSRATMDMDTTIKGYPLTMKSVESMIEKICAVSLHDGFSFHIKEIDNIHEHNDYEGYRVGLEAEFGTIRAPLKLDITTGDIITPCETTYGYQLMFEDRSIPIKAYNLETILAEKIETIISRGDLNTRMRDYYDVYALLHLGKTRVNWDFLGVRYLLQLQRGTPSQY